MKTRKYLGAAEFVPKSEPIMFRKPTTIAAILMLLAGCIEGVGVEPVVVEPVVDEPTVITVAAIRIDEVSTELLPGGTVQLVAHALNAKGETMSGQVIVFSANSTIATVSPAGLLTLNAPGTVAVTAAAGGHTRTREFIIKYPVPTMLSITPTSVPTLASAIINVRGTGFFAGTKVQLDGVTRSSTLVNNTEMQVTLGAFDVAVASAAAITVVNPAPGGGTSGSLPLLIVGANANCDSAAPLTIGTPLTGQLETSDCNYGTLAAPSYRDAYYFTTTAPTGVMFSMTSSFGPALVLTDSTGNLTPHAVATANRPGPALLRLLLPAKAFALIAGGVDVNGLGAYALTSSNLSVPDVTNCDTWYVVPPLDLAQAITRIDCGLAPHGAENSAVSATGLHEWFWDEYRIVLRAGQTATITIESSAFEAGVWLSDANGRYAGNYSSGPGTSAELTFAALAAGVYKIEAGSGDAMGIGAIGAYRIRVR